RRLPLPVSAFYSQLGRCHRAGRGLDEARVLYLRSLALRRDPLKDDAGIVENLADLAGLHSAGGDTPRALSETRAALALLRSSAGERHPLAIDLLRTLCSLERESSDTAGAERDCSQALALAMDLRGPKHQSTIDARRQLAAIHVDQGRLAEAEAEFQDTLGWMLTRLGDRHADIARNYNSLAIVAWERGDEATALRHLERAVDIWRETGSDSLLAAGLFNLAMVLHDAGRDAEAEPLLREALALRRTAFGERHGLVGDTLRLLGEVEADLGRDTAGATLRRAQELTRQDYGPQHSHTRRAEISLARFEAADGEDAALARLDALADLPPAEHELRKAGWLARAYAAGLRCRQPGARALALSNLDALLAQLQQALPEGGAVSREVHAVREACQSGRPAARSALSPAAAAAAAVRSGPRRA
ncbi:MAG: tetratricopeptide repeat protein, partial [Luteimonas sp.]|nr:tetratricopeptide repeat protein [Luteimonas sp.]